MAGAFGLLHGFGFAGALSEVGMPQNAVPLALLLFNVGVEVGQLLFVAGVLLLVWAVRKSKFQWQQRLESVAAYGIGSIAAYWTIERTVGMFG